MGFFAQIPYWLIAIIMLGILILVHELGHYIIGRLLKFKINEFSIGMGPRLFGWTRKEIKYSVRAIPLGGYVAFFGEDEDNPNDERAMNNMPWYKRIAVMFAGAGFNIIFALVMTAVLICSTGYYAPGVVEIEPQAPLAQTQAQVGDIIYGINGTQALSVQHFTQLLDNAGDDFKLTVSRNGEKIDIQTSKFVNADGQKKLGISFEYASVDQNVFESIGYSAKYNLWLTGEMYKTLGELISGKQSVDNLSGPISTIGIIGSTVQDVANQENVEQTERVRHAVIIIVELLVIISMNLAIMNLLPIPALDGFRIVFALIEGIFKKKINRDIEAKINFGGLVTLILLMVVLEVSKLF